MIDIDLIREHPEILEDAAAKRGIDIPVSEAADLDKQRRLTIVEIDNLRAKRNDVSRELGRLKEKPAELIQDMREVGGRIKQLEEQERDIAIKLESILMNIPNLPAETVPIGDDEDGNVVVRTIGEKPKFDFEVKPHWQIGEDLSLIHI